MDSKASNVHVMFLPYLAPGHMMPMVDMARLFAANGLRVTIITTTMNAARFKNLIDRDVECGQQVSLETIRFPSKEAGLPEGCENLSSAATPEMTVKLFHGIELLEPQVRLIFQKHQPDCIVSDYLFPWTVDVAIKLGIPRLAFNGSGFFSLCVAISIDCYQPHKSIMLETEPFVIPGLPDEVTITRSQLQDIAKDRNDVFSGLFDKLKEAEKKSFGVLVNSFYELEPAYADHFKKVTGIKAWHLGPVSLFNRSADDRLRIGDEDSCLNWLDSKKPKSVLYVCFGSLIRFSKNQISEIASALENSRHSFIWTVGKILKNDNEVENNEDQQQEWWLPEGYETRLKQSDKGFFIKDWAPQVLILENPAIGGFLTHCGWNSILESICAGVPMVTWPIFAEQFHNEKLITQVLKCGVPIGDGTWRVWANEESPLIGRNSIEKAVGNLMGDTHEATKMRKQAGRLAEFARFAIQEGGSSYEDLQTLVADITTYKSARDLQKSR